MKELTHEQIIAAAKLSEPPKAGATVNVTRAGAKAEIPIQVIMNTLRATYPGTKFVFGAPKAINSKP